MELEEANRQQSLERAKQREQEEKEKAEKETAEKSGNKRNEEADPKKDPPKAPDPPSPPKQPGEPIPVARPNPDDGGGGDDGPHRPYHLGLGFRPSLPAIVEAPEDVRTALARQGLFLDGWDDEWGGPAPNVRWAANADEVPNPVRGPNPPLDGPNPPEDAGMGGDRTPDPLVRDLRLRYLLATREHQSGEDVVLNPRALGYKPNPDDPYGPIGPNARVRDNPRVGGGLRPRTGRLA